MTMHLGNVDAGSTLYIPFATYGKTNGESITLTGLAVTDIEIYKNGSATQRASDAGYTLLDTDGIDFDGLTGIHGFSVDLSDNTDVGFYAAGSFYWVVVSAVTVDSQTVNFIAATFRIGPAAANMTQILGTAVSTPATNGILDVNVKNMNNAPVTATTSVTFPDACTVATTTGAVGSVTGAVGSVTGLTASNLDATISSRMATYTQPTGFLAATFPTTVASTTNITDATVTLKNGVTHGGATAKIALQEIVVLQTTAASPAVKLTGATSGAGLECIGGATGHGIVATAEPTTGSGCGIVATGVGTTKPGILATGGATTSAGIEAVGGATSGDGMIARAVTSGKGLVVTGKGTTMPGLLATGGATSSAGISIIATGVGDGILINAGNYALNANTGIFSDYYGTIQADGVNSIWAKAMSDLTAVPAATASAAAALNWLFELARNKRTTTATTETVFKDDAATTLATSTVSDDATTFTRTEWA